MFIKRIITLHIIITNIHKKILLVISLLSTLPNLKLYISYYNRIRDKQHNDDIVYNDNYGVYNY